MTTTTSLIGHLTTVVRAMRLIFSVQIGGVGHGVCESFLKVAWLLAETDPQTVECCGDLTFSRVQ